LKPAALAERRTGRKRDLGDELNWLASFLAGIEIYWNAYVAWASTWSDTWFKDLLSFITTLVWPAVVIVALVLFRKPLSEFVNEISELGLWGASAKRQGDRAARDLNQEQEEQLVAEEGEDTANPAPSEDNSTNPGPTEGSGQPSPTTGTEAAQPSATDARVGEFLEYYRSISLLQLRGNRKNTASTNSTRVAREIVRSTYSDYLATVRVVAFWLHGPTAVSGARGRKANSHVTLQRMGAPEDLIEATVELRTFAVNVADGSITLTGEGARTYVNTVDDAMTRLFAWAKQQIDEP
jgi:hypothetical protein